MADNTGIEWTDATWNPTVGCKVVSPGCTNCYAMKVAARMESISIAHSSAHGGDPGPMYYYRDLVTDTRAGPVWNGTFREAPHDLLERPLRWKRPRRIFVNSMSDLFGDGVDVETIDRVFAVMTLCPQHTFQILTKRPERMRDYIANVKQMRSVQFPDGSTYRMGPWSHTDAPIKGAGIGKRWPLPNVWLGVSVEDQKRADERIPILLDTPAAVRWISAEPLLGPVDLMDIDWPSSRPKFPETDDISDARSALHTIEGSRLDWVVVGGESGPGSRPMHPDWARSLRDQCKAAGVAFLFKQWGNWAACRDSQGFWPVDEGGCIKLRTDGTKGEDGWPMQNVGKKHAGRLLDGVEHNEYPGTK
jgi:protein gp37